MALTLTTPFTAPNGTRLVITSARVDDDAAVAFVTVEIRSAVATDLVLARRTLAVRNGPCDRIKRNAAPSAGQTYDEAAVVFEQGINLPTAYTDAVAAWRSGATPAARRAALEAQGLTSGWIDASLNGS